MPDLEDCTDKNLDNILDLMTPDQDPLFDEFAINIRQFVQKAILVCLTDGNQEKSRYNRYVHNATYRDNRHEDRCTKRKTGTDMTDHQASSASLTSPLNIHLEIQQNLKLTEKNWEQLQLVKLQLQWY